MVGAVDAMLLEDLIAARVFLGKRVEFDSVVIKKFL
jgi:hypothetical protein